MRTPEFIKAPTKQPRLLLRRLRLRAAGIRVEADLPTERIGRGEEGLTVHPDPLGPDSIVYAFGVGTEAGWDRAMIDRFGCTVHAFDPTPQCVEWVGQQLWPDGFAFHPVGIGDRDGTMRFFPPRTTRTVNYSTINRKDEPDEAAVEVPVQRLSTIARDLGHDRIDLLKLDIEGGEYAVLQDLLESGIPIGQLLVEFHHGYPQLSFDDTRRAIESLRSHGYRIFDISRRGREFGLISSGPAPAADQAPGR